MQGRLLGLAVLALGTGSAWAQDPASAQFYSEKVQPVLQANCYSCHGGTSHRGGLSLATKAGMLKGGHDGTVLVPGSPHQAALSATLTALFGRGPRIVGGVQLWVPTPG